MISHHRVIKWMNLIRETEGKEQQRILEIFWESQLNSKIWVINNLKNYFNLYESSVVYIFAGWYGILAQLIVQNFPKVRVYSIDIDESCAFYGKKLMLTDDNIEFITNDMREFNNYEPNTSLIINTSTEHIPHSVFDEWMQNIPSNIPIVLQGNNFFECKEHIRCAETLDTFKLMNPLHTYVYSGELKCPGPTTDFTRFMTMGYKQ